MLVDAHTHIFPFEALERRDELCTRDSAFRELYGDPKAKLAVAPELSAALDRNQTDYAVALGFAWSDPDLCRWHNDALLAAAQTDHRIIPFCTVSPVTDAGSARREAERCSSAGARGIGELRPHSTGMDLDGEAGRVLAEIANANSLTLLFHASEPAGHDYPGKTGGEIGSLWRFIARNPSLTVICAHWGGGLPFYALMPEVRAALRNTWFDTAATTLLYEPAIYRRVIDLVGAERILFGSDLPLLGPRRQMRAVGEAPITADERALILGDNAGALFGLKGERGGAIPWTTNRPAPGHS